MSIKLLDECAGHAQYGLACFREWLISTLRLVPLAFELGQLLLPVCIPVGIRPALPPKQCQEIMISDVTWMPDRLNATRLRFYGSYVPHDMKHYIPHQCI